jgi:predicted MPP superfamily phosphohydrolase
LSALAALLALAVYAVWIEPLWIEVKMNRLGGPSATAADTTTPPRPRLRIAQLSDLHLQSIGRRETRVAEQIARLQPDLVVLSGDVIDRADALPVLDAFLLSLQGRPTVAVLGNWEHWSEIDLAQLQSTYARHPHATLLVNASQLYRLGGGQVQVHGLDDHTAGQPQLPQLEPESPQGRIQVLVQHSPAWFDEAAAQRTTDRYDLCLAGHTHGGQIALGNWAPFTPPGSGRFVAGFYDLPSCRLFVSRGAGTSVLPLRWGAKAEVLVFDL